MSATEIHQACKICEGEMQLLRRWSIGQIHRSTSLMQWPPRVQFRKQSVLASYYLTHCKLKQVHNLLILWIKDSSRLLQFFHKYLHILYKWFPHNDLSKYCQRMNIEGSRPEWCISSMKYSRHTPFWAEALELYLLHVQHLLCKQTDNENTNLALRQWTGNLLLPGLGKRTNTCEFGHSIFARLFASRLPNFPATCKAWLRDRSAYTVLCATTPKYKLKTKFAIAPSHGKLTSTN